MGRYLNPGHVYIDGQTVTGPSLTEHVSEASFETTAWTEQTLKDPAALTDQILIVASDAFFYTTIQQIHDLIIYPGSIVQTQYGEYTANTNLTSVIPNDDTIPQNTEGTEIISLSITPRFATSTIFLSFGSSFSTASASWVGCALFRDNIATALAANLSFQDNSNGVDQCNLTYMDSPATTSVIAYKIRVGPLSADTLRLNGNTATRIFGGACRATLVAQEIKV